MNTLVEVEVKFAERDSVCNTGGDNGQNSEQEVV